MLLSVPERGYAAGLGALTLHSSLGQHLDAEIEVITDNATELESISAAMASYDVFRQMGIAPVSVLTQIRFEIDKDAASATNGGAVLKLSSLTPVREPFLDLVVELSWNGGTYLREYTFLLDPIMVQHSTETVNESELALIEPVSVVPEHIIVVQRGDNLLDIARSLQSTEFTAEQLAIAIYDTNPNAFYGSVHKLKRGAELYIPDSAIALEINESDARKRLQRAPGNKSVSAVVPDKAEQLPAAPEHLQVVSASPASSQAVVEVTRQMTAARHDDGESSVKALKVVIMELRTTMVGLGQELDVKTSQLDEIGKRVDQLQQRQAISRSNTDALGVLAPSIKTAVPVPLDEVPEEILVEQDSDALAESPKSQPDVVPSDAGIPMVSDDNQTELVDVPSPVSVESAPEKTGLFTWFFDTRQNQLVADSLRNTGLVLLASLLGYVLLRQYFGKDDRLVDIELSPSPVNGDSMEMDLSVRPSPSGEVSDVVNPLSTIEYFRGQLTSEQRREQGLKEALEEMPEQQQTRLELLRVYSDRGAVDLFAQTARDMFSMTGGKNAEWHEVIEIGLSLDPNMSFYDQTGDHGFILNDEFNIGEDAVTSVSGGKSTASTPAVNQQRNNLVSAATDKARVRLDEVVSNRKPLSEAEPELDIDLDALPDKAQPFLDEEELDNVEWKSPSDEGLTNDELDTLKPAASGPSTMSDTDFNLDTDPDLGLDSGVDASDDTDAVSYYKPELSWKDCEVRLDLAVVYIDLGNTEGASGLLAEVLTHGDASQQKVAQGLLSKLQ